MNCLTSKPIRTTVDVDAIAAGLLDLIEEMPDADSYKGALAFGMLPAPLMRMMNESLWSWVKEHTAEFEPDAESLELCAIAGIDAHAELEKSRSAWVRRVEKEVSAAMYRIASDRGQLLV